MSNIKILKDALEQSYTTFKQSKSALARAISRSSEVSSTRSISVKLNSLEESLVTLNATHTSWVSKAEFQADDLAAETFSDKWLESIWEEADELCDKANEIIHRDEVPTEPPTLSLNNKLLILVKQMDSFQLNVTNEIDVLYSNTDVESLPSASHTVYTEMMTKVVRQLESPYIELSHSILTLSGNNTAKIIDEHETFRQTQHKRLLDVQVNLAKLATSTPDTTIATSLSRPSSGTIGSSRTVEMEKCKAPTFNGKTIDYPEFKRGWCKIAATVWDDGNQMEQIKHKVDTYTKKIVSRCKDMNEVWDALDKEYGQEQEVVNAVNMELKELRLGVCSTPEYIVKLRNFLPGLEEALKSVDGLEHLQTPDKVNYLVGKFDERTQYDWEYFKSKSTGKTYDRFFSFILDRYDSCRSTIARLNDVPLDPTRCPTQSLNHLVMSCHKCNKWVAKGGNVTCPACGNTTTQGELLGHCLEHCSKYEAMSANQRSDCIKNAKWCPVHLSSSHDLSRCAQRNDVKCGMNGCDKHHHRSLHGSTTSFIVDINTLSVNNMNNEISTVDDSDTDNVLLSFQTVGTTSGTMNCFFDNGSTCCLILNSTADRLQLKGETVVITLTSVNGEEDMQTRLFDLKLTDIKGKEHKVKAFGVPKISGDIDNVNLDGLKQLFSSETQQLWSKVDTRPTGEVEFLLGGNYIGLHPIEHECNGNVKVMKSIFGSGYIAVGRHSSIRSTRVTWDATVSSLRVHHTQLSYKSVRDYLNSYDLAVPAPRRCKDCMNCNECSFRGHQMSLQEQYEIQVMEDKVEYNSTNKEFRVEYAFTESPSILTNNLGQVIKIAEREEKKLKKDGLTEAFNTEFDKMIELGALVELTEEDRRSWKGAVHYVSLQHVHKPDSPTTPLRIVTNSSLSDRNGISLNSILMKGPNILSNQFDVLSRWRNYDTALCSDFTKAYYSMKTGEVEKHVRRVVWRYGDTDKKWRHFAYQTVSFGDKPAGVYLDIVINKTADLFRDIDPEAAQKIKNDRYVDDLTTGGSSALVERLEGNNDITSSDKFETSGTLAQILLNGSLKLKVVVTSGEQDTEKINRLGNSVLGVGWSPQSDIVKVDMRGNSHANSSLETRDPSKLVLTKRTILGIVNKPYDLLGLLSPITICLRVAYRDLFRLEEDLGWDDEIPPKKRAEWIELLNLVYEVACVEFPRATRPKNAVGSPDLIGYFDGSDNAYAAVIYFRWTLEDGSIDVRLVCSKAKVTPLKRMSTPRSELNGAVVLSRLVLSVIKAISVSGTIPNKVWLLGDSECTLSSIEKTSGAFGEYFGNRVGEILDNQAQIEKWCEVGDNGEWWHLPSENNAADRPTRLDSTLEDVSVDSPWQKGPNYLYLSREEWPINRDFATRKESIIPSVEILKRYREIIQEVDVRADIGIHNMIDPLFTNDWSKLVYRTQLLLHATACFLHKQGEVDIAARFEAAEQLWFKYAMKETKQAQLNGRLKNLCVEERDGVVVVVGRASAGLQKLFGKDCLPVLMSSSRVAVLIMLWAHYQNHDARDITMSIACKKAWIVKAKGLATSITKNCVRCRFLHKRKVEQKMADLPPEIQLPCPPFSNIGLDLCGPLVVHSMTNKRATLKVWNVIFVCLNTKAVTMYLAPGYSTEDFMLAYNSHISDHGLPNKVHSDRGSQLVAAGKEVNFEWDIIAERACTQGTKWDFAPAGAQWRNGAVEIFVKKFKKSFEVLYGKTRMNFAELSCGVKRIANVLNDRPLSVQKSHVAYPNEDFLTPITPNMLITGRSGNYAPLECEDGNDLPEDRLSYIEELERSWWYQYKVQYFTSLIPTQKWLNAGRNMCPGDVVLVEYKSKSFPGTYRLGRVKDVEVDSRDGLVRTCTVIYKLIKSPMKNIRDVHRDVTTKEIRVPVQRLILILPFEEQ